MASQSMGMSHFVGAHSDNYTLGRKGHTPIAIVNHIMMGTMEGTIGEFSRAGKEKSTHFGIAKNGNIVCFVRPENMAYGNGIVRSPQTQYAPIARWVHEGINPNLETISIEWEGSHKLYPDVGPWYSYQWKNPITKRTETVNGMRRESIKTMWVPNVAQIASGIVLHKALIEEFGLVVDRSHIIRHSDIDGQGKWFCPYNGFPLGDILKALQHKAE